MIEVGSQSDGRYYLGNLIDLVGETVYYIHNQTNLQGAFMRLSCRVKFCSFSKEGLVLSDVSSKDVFKGGLIDNGM